MNFRWEAGVPADDNEEMSAARRAREKNPEVVAVAKEALRAMLESNT